MLSGTEINLLNLHLTPKYQQVRRRENDFRWNRVSECPSRREIRALAASKSWKTLRFSFPLVKAEKTGFSPTMQRCGQFMLHINIPATLGQFQLQRPVLEMKPSRFKRPTSGKSSQAQNQAAPKMAFPSRSGAASHKERGTLRRTAQASKDSPALDPAGIRWKEAGIPQAAATEEQNLL